MVKVVSTIYEKNNMLSLWGIYPKKTEIGTEVHPPEIHFAVEYKYSRTKLEAIYGIPKRTVIKYIQNAKPND